MSATPIVDRATYSLDFRLRTLATGLAAKSDRPIFFYSCSLLLESESPVVDENCQVDRPDLEAPFAFMQEYMSVTRSTPPQTPTAQ